MSNDGYSNEWKVGGLYQYDGVGIYSSLFENPNPKASNARDRNDLYICIGIVSDLMSRSDTKARLINMRTYRVYESRASKSYQRVI